MPTLNWIGGTRPGNDVFVPPPPEQLSALRLHEHLLPHAVTSAALASGKSGVNRSSTVVVLNKLIELGIVRELTGSRRNRLFAYDAYLALLSRDTEPLPP